MLETNYYCRKEISIRTNLKLAVNWNLKWAMQIKMVELGKTVLEVLRSWSKKESLINMEEAASRKEL